MSYTPPTQTSAAKPAYRRPSLWLMVRAVLFGALGLALLPILAAAVVLALTYFSDQRCGAPSDSGGCETGAFGIGIASALPGFVIFFFVTLIRGMQREARMRTAKFTLDI